MNKFEQVSSDGHQMSLTWGGVRAGGGPMSDIQGAGASGLYIEVQCIMGKGHMGTPFPMDRQT